MTVQTIALFRYLMLGILSHRFVVLVAVLILVAVLAASFLAELAIINGQAIVAAFVADFMRYTLALFLLLMIANSVADDYEYRQFERLLTMPLARWQYIAAQVMVITSLSAMLALPAALLAWFYGTADAALYWFAALWLEFFLLGLLGLLAILSLEKIPQAVFFALSIYLLAKLSGLISLMVVESVKMAEGSFTSRAVEFIVNTILYVVPGTEAFAENDIFFGLEAPLGVLGDQLLATVVYSLFILLVSLVDFYRKEFNI